MISDSWYLGPRLGHGGPDGRSRQGSGVRSEDSRKPHQVVSGACHHVWVSVKARRLGHLFRQGRMASVDELGAVLHGASGKSEDLSNCFIFVTVTDS